MSRWQEMDLGIKSQRTTYHSFSLRLVKRCQVLLDMAARNNVTASHTTPLIWPHLLVWERLAGPAEIENAFRQLTNESVALGYRSLPGGCAPSILWLTGLASQRFSDLLACRVLWTALAALCNELCSLCKGRWTDLFTKTTSVLVPSLLLYVLLSVFLSVKPLSSPCSSSSPALPTLPPIRTQRHRIHPGFILLTASCSLFSTPHPLSFHADCPSFVGLFQRGGFFPFFVLSQHD